MTRKRTPPDPLNIPAEVLSLRKSLGWSQAEMARRCKVSQPTLSAIESGQYAPRIATLRALASGSGRIFNIGDKNGRLFSRPKSKPRA